MLNATYELEEPIAKAAIEKNFQATASEINMQKQPPEVFCKRRCS